MAPLCSTRTSTENNYDNNNNNNNNRRVWTWNEIKTVRGGISSFNQISTNAANFIISLRPGNCTHTHTNTCVSSRTVAVEKLYSYIYIYIYRVNSVKPLASPRHVPDPASPVITAGRMWYVEGATS